MALIDNLLTNAELKETYKIDLINRFGVKEDETTELIQEAYDDLVTHIFELNHDLVNDESIVAYLTTASAIALFKSLQARVIANKIKYGEQDPCDEYVDKVIRYRLHMSKMNGFQK